MTAHQIILVKKSWALMQKIDPSIVADAFYSKLFADRPMLRKMFPAEMKPQYQKLIDMLNAVIERLDRLDELTAEIEAMAVRHRGYGVKNTHYTLVGDALLWTLERAQGKDWTNELQQAWTASYSTLANVMIEAANKTKQH